MDCIVGAFWDNTFDSGRRDVVVDMDMGRGAWTWTLRLGLGLELISGE